LPKLLWVYKKEFQLDSIGIGEAEHRAHATRVLNFRMSDFMSVEPTRPRLEFLGRLRNKREMVEAGAARVELSASVAAVLKEIWRNTAIISKGNTPARGSSSMARCN
jgi:hypothetical protein